MVNPLLSTCLDLSSNMMISSVFSNDNSLYTINKICMVTFFIIFLFRATKTHFISKLKHSQSSISIIKLLLLTILKLVYYGAFIYNLISYSFLISELANHAIAITMYYLQPTDESQLQIFSLKSKSVSFTMLAMIIFIFVEGSLNNIFTIFLVIGIEQGSLFLMNKLKKQKSHNPQNDTISFMLCIILTLGIALQEILAGQNYQQLVAPQQNSEFIIFLVFMSTILSFAFIKQDFDQKDKKVRNKYQSLIVLFIFVTYELTLTSKNLFNLKIVIPALVFMAIGELYNTSDQIEQSSLELEFQDINLHKYSALTMKNFLTHIKNNQDSKFLLIQLTINFSFMFVELIYGFLSNSLGLISDSVHMLIDSSALALGLYASFVARLQPNQTFSFGYERVEVLSGFVNGIFLLFVVVEIMSESFARLLNPQKVLPEKMILVSTLGLAINLLGLFFFHEHGHIHTEEEEDHKKISHNGEAQECSGHHDNSPDHKHDHSHGHHNNQLTFESTNDNNNNHDHQHKHEHKSNCKHEHKNEHEQDLQHQDENDYNYHNNEYEPIELSQDDTTGLSKYQSLTLQPKDTYLSCTPDQTPTNKHLDHIDENEDEEEESHGHGHHHHHHNNHNLTGVYLHILADALGSVACIISAVIIYFYDFYLADPITSLIMSVLILFTTVQLLKSTTKILLFQIPSYGLKINTVIREKLNDLPLLSSYDLKLWHFAGKAMVILGKFRIKQKDENIINQQILAIFEGDPRLRFKAIDYEYIE